MSRLRAACEGPGVDETAILVFPGPADGMAEKAREEGGSSATKWVIGCAVALVGVALLCGGVAWLGFGWIQSRVVDWAHGAATEFVQRSDLPPDQVESMLADLDRLRAAHREGRIGYGEIEELLAALESGPLVPLVALRAFDGRILADAELGEDEKRDARRALQRCARGLEEGTIRPLEVNEQLSVSFEGPPAEGWHERWRTPDEVRATVAALRGLADRASVPDEAHEPDVAGELHALVDELLD